MRDYVILVDENDIPMGTGEKLRIHQQGLLHRAFSAFVFDSKRRFLLQKRAKTKYHCGGLWSNTCCSHPKLGDTLLWQAQQRLQQEMGFSCPLRSEFHFIYRAVLPNQLIEHELDHVLIGHFDGTPKPNPEEVDEWKSASLSQIEAGLEAHPDAYTPWFKIALERLRLTEYWAK